MALAPIPQRFLRKQRGFDKEVTPRSPAVSSALSLFSNYKLLCNEAEGVKSINVIPSNFCSP